MNDNTQVQQSPPRMLVGSDDFGKLMLEADIYVDKTLLIKAFFENPSETLLITRPRRWGKSMNLDMIGKFFSIEADAQGHELPQDKKHYPKLFTGGEIDLGFSTGDTKLIKPSKLAEHPEFIKKHMGKYPVIQIGFKQIKGRSYDEMESKIKLQVEEMFYRHKYLAHSPLLDEEQKSKLSKYLTGDISTLSHKNPLML